MASQIKALSDVGVAALCGGVRSVRETAQAAGSAVSSLASATAGALDEVDEALEAKADKGRCVAITIPATGWGNDGGEGYPNYYDIAAAGVTAKDRASITIAPDSLRIAAACGLCPTNETLDGKIRVRAVDVPAAVIAAEYWIEKGTG